MSAGHGPNVGHGFTKYIIIGADGQELEPVILPSTIARAQRATAGSLRRATTIDAGGHTWWVGDDALLSSTSLTLLSQERLVDAAFIPALLRGALGRFGHLNGASHGYCVSGLPATWAQDRDKCMQLGERLRGAAHYTGIRVVAEPLGPIYAAALDNNGQIAGDAALTGGRVGIVDLGHLTVDLAIVDRLQPLPESLETFQLGTAQPLKQIRAQLSAHFERELTLLETDLAVRAGTLTVAGRERDLPFGWDDPLLQNAEAVTRRLVEAWGRGAQLDTILLAGGGAAERRLAQAITARFPHALAVAQPQTAIARGYAKLARRFALTQR